MKKGVKWKGLTQEDFDRADEIIRDMAKKPVRSDGELISDWLKRTAIKRKSV